MATNYTNEYGLCQWAEEDKVNRLEFNQDNSRIEAGLLDLLNKLETVQSSLAQEVEGLEGKITQSQENMDNLTSNLSTVEQSLQKMEGDVTVAEGNIATMQSNVSEVIRSLEELENGMDGFEDVNSNITTLTEAIASLDTRLTKKVKAASFTGTGTSLSQTFDVGYKINLLITLSYNYGVNSQFIRVDCNGFQSCAGGTTTLSSSGISLGSTSFTVTGDYNVKYTSYMVLMFCND